MFRYAQGERLVKKGFKAMGKFNDKVAVVTGAGQGAGKIWPSGFTRRGQPSASWT